VILGGMGTLCGPVIGAFVLVLIEDALMSLTDHWLLVLGIFVILLVVLVPHGLAGLVSRIFEQSHTRPRPAARTGKPLIAEEAPNV
jgi:branched-chain amino acid transport system permease protein